MQSQKQTSYALTCRPINMIKINESSTIHTFIGFTLFVKIAQRTILPTSNYEPIEMCPLTMLCSDHGAVGFRLRVLRRWIKINYEFLAENYRIIKSNGVLASCGVVVVYVYYS